jgi:hypothetical protein
MEDGGWMMEWEMTSHPLSSILHPRLGFFVFFVPFVVNRSDPRMKKAEAGSCLGCSHWCRARSLRGPRVTLASSSSDFTAG